MLPAASNVWQPLQPFDAKSAFPAAGSPAGASSSAVVAGGVVSVCPVSVSAGPVSVSVGPCLGLGQLRFDVSGRLGAFVLGGEDDDGPDHRHHEEQRHHDEEADAFAAGKVRPVPRDHQGGDEREGDEDRRRPGKAELLVGRQPEEHARNLPNGFN